MYQYRCAIVRWTTFVSVVLFIGQIGKFGGCFIMFVSSGG